MIISAAGSAVEVADHEYVREAARPRASDRRDLIVVSRAEQAVLAVFGGEQFIDATAVPKEIASSVLDLVACNLCKELADSWRVAGKVDLLVLTKSVLLYLII